MTVPRNLCTTICEFCDIPPTALEEPRLLLPREAGAYFREYEGMLVQRARCRECWAEYLVWVGNIPGRHGSGPRTDMCFYHSFDEEPDIDDLPLRKWSRWNSYWGERKPERLAEVSASRVREIEAWALAADVLET